MANSRKNKIERFDAFDMDFCFDANGEKLQFDSDPGDWLTWGVEDDCQTYRGAKIRSPVKEVFEKFGESEIYNFNKKNDELLKIGKEFNSNNVKTKLEKFNDGIKYIEYISSGQVRLAHLRFYLDEKDIVILIGAYFTSANFENYKDIPIGCRVVYYWYSGKVDDGDLEKIDEAFSNKDFKTFQKYYKKYDDGFTFPDDADVWDKEEYDIIGHIKINNKDVIEHLAYADYEAG